MKLNRLQRHTAYIIMLQEYLNGGDLVVKSFKQSGFCYLMESVFDFPFDNNRMNGLVELKKKQPNNMFDPDINLWFNADKEGVKKRVEILKQCIKETA